jgi:hypothetical protein
MIIETFRKIVFVLPRTFGIVFDCGPKGADSPRKLGIVMDYIAVRRRLSPMCSQGLSGHSFEMRRLDNDNNNRNSDISNYHDRTIALRPAALGARFLFVTVFGWHS